MVPAERLEAGGHLLQERVAGFVAVGVIDVLEAVEVEIGDRDGLAAGALGGDRVGQRADEGAAIGEAGQPVMGCGVAGFRFALLDLPEAADDDEEQDDHDQRDQREHREAGLG